MINGATRFRHVDRLHGDSAAAELSRVRGMTPASLNTFSNANRTRDPKVMQTFFWTVYGIYRSHDPGFVKGRHHGRLSRFRLRNIYAIDSTTILLLTHLVLRWLKYRSGAACSYSRFAALVRAIVWLKKDAMAILRSYGIAPPTDSGGVASGMPYLPGFEKMFLKPVG